MEKNVSDAILNVCSILNKHSVQYLAVGGTAVTFHGHFRHSKNSAGQIINKPDLDFWYNPTYKNYFNLLNALEELGQDVKEFKDEQAPDPLKSFFRFELEKFTLDLLPVLKTKMKFDTAYMRREVTTLNQIKIPFISYEDLILDKQTNPRSKDLEDIEQLQLKKKSKK